MKLRYILFLSIGVGFILRLMVILENGYGPTYDCPAATDEIDYREIARNIRENKIFGVWSEGFFTQSLRAPVYPMMLAFANFAGTLWSGLLMNLFLDTVNIFLVYILAKWLFGELSANISSLVYALFAPSFIYIRFTTPEIFSVFLLLCFLLSICKYENFYSLWTFSVVIFYALLIHTRPSFLPVSVVVPFLIYLKLYRTECDFKKRLLSSTLPFIFICLLCIPWTIRNYAIQKTIVPIIVIPAWHAMESKTKDSSLEIEPAMDFIYSPQRRGWTEGQYFNEAKRQAFRLFKEHHFKILLLGAYRILNSWCFLNFYERIYLPKAYFNPVYIGEKFWIPLPDFEGVVYVFVISLIFAIFAKPDRVKLLLAKYNEYLWMLLFVISYIGVHIIAIPFPQYRFLIEPILLIFATGPIVLIFKGKVCEERQINFNFIFYISVLVLFCIFFPLLVSAKQETKYFSNRVDLIDYDMLRDIQWNNNGFIPDRPFVRLSGRVRYIRKGYEFVEKGHTPAMRNELSSVGKLYVGESIVNSLGIGDVKLNFSSEILPQENDYISCTGRARTGIFRDILIDVESWSLLE